MIREAIDRIVQMTAESVRPSVSLLKLPDGSQRHFIFDPSKATWVEQPLFLVPDITVSSPTAFAEMIRSLIGPWPVTTVSGSDAHPVRLNPPTVTLTPEGGKCFPRGLSDQRQAYGYKRRMSSAYDAVRSIASTRGHTHQALLLALQNLRDSIPNFDALYRDFRKIRFDASASVNSNPVLTDGKKGEVFTIEVTLKGGTASATEVPSSFELRFQPVVGWDFTIQLTAYLDVELAGRTVAFSVNIPRLNTVIEQVVLAEAVFMRESLKDTGALVLDAY